MNGDTRAARWAPILAVLGLDQPVELQDLQTRLLKRLLWLLLGLLGVLAVSDAMHGRPTLPVLLALMLGAGLGLPALSRWSALRVPLTLLFAVGLLGAVLMEAGFYDIAVPPSTAFLVLGGPLVTLIVGPIPGLGLTLVIVACQFWLEHLYPIESARALRSVGNALIAVGWAQMTALFFQRMHADLGRRLVQEQRALRRAVDSVQGLAQATFDGLQVPLMALELRLADPAPLGGADLEPQLQPLREQLQAARERTREAALPQDPLVALAHQDRMRQLGLLAQLWAAWAALLLVTVQGLWQSLPLAMLLPSLSANVLLGAVLLVFRRRLSALRPVTWAAATLFYGLIAWGLAGWGGQYPAPPYYFLAPLVMVMALLDGFGAGALAAVACGGLVVWSTARSPSGGQELDQALNVLATLVLALFAAGQALILHRKLDRGLTQQGLALQKALRLRRRLLGTLFHDLSNPLAMLQLAADLGEGSPLDMAERERLAKLVERMQTLVASARDFVAVDGPLPPERMLAVALGPLLNELRQQLQPRLQAAGQELRIYCAPQLAAMASPVVLRESVVSNLLKLAMARCSPGAKLTLSVTSQGEAVLLKLQDPGRPLSAEDLQSTGSLPQGDEGPGVALALVHEHLLRMGGALRLINLDEGGSMATVQLRPVEAP